MFRAGELPTAIVPKLMMTDNIRGIFSRHVLV